MAGQSGQTMWPGFSSLTPFPSAFFCIVLALHMETPSRLISSSFKPNRKETHLCSSMRDPCNWIHAILNWGQGHGSPYQAFRKQCPLWEWGIWINATWTPKAERGEDRALHKIRSCYQGLWVWVANTTSVHFKWGLKNPEEEEVYLERWNGP